MAGHSASTQAGVGGLRVVHSPLPAEKYLLLDRLTSSTTSELFGTLHRALVRSTNQALVIRTITNVTTESRITMLSESQKFHALLHAPPKPTSGKAEVAGTPFLLPILEIYTHKDTIWIVHPYFSTGSVYDVMQHQRGKRITSEEMIRSILRTVVRSLAHLHAHACYHGHLKASNIMLDADDTLLLADYGLAIRQLEVGVSSECGSAYLHWLPPEACTSDTMVHATTNAPSKGAAGKESVDPRVAGAVALSQRQAAWDIWTVGTLAFELSLGAPPYIQFAPRRAHALLRDHSPPILVGNFSPLLKSFVARCLVKDVDKRPTAAMLCDDPYLNYASPLVVQVARAPPATRINASEQGGIIDSMATHNNHHRMNNHENNRVASWTLHEALTCALDQRTSARSNGTGNAEEQQQEQQQQQLALRLVEVLRKIETFNAQPPMANAKKSFKDDFCQRLTDNLSRIGVRSLTNPTEKMHQGERWQTFNTNLLSHMFLCQWKEDTKRVLSTAQL